ACPSSSS
ncbi:hypothetical protein KIPB_017278, partial [Kipferlia bialata]